jgi:hypothetical protein
MFDFKSRSNALVEFSYKDKLLFYQIKIQGQTFYLLLYQLKFQFILKKKVYKVLHHINYSNHSLIVHKHNEEGTKI